MSRKPILNRSKIKEEVINYIKKELKVNCIPSYDELNKKFGIGYLKITTKELYLQSGVRLLNPIVKRRPTKSIDMVREELIAYLKETVGEDHYPSRRELEGKFKLRLAPDLFRSIKDLYKQAGIKYKQQNNQSIKSKKAKLLVEVISKNIEKLNLSLIKTNGTHQRGVDIITKDKNNNIIGIELKAYNKNEMVKKRNIEQIENWLKTKSFHKIILITTTSKIENNVEVPKNVEIIKFEDLIKICNKNSFKKIRYIRDYSVHIDTKEHEVKRKLIKNYIRYNYEDNERININEINNILKLDIYTYFKNQLELYKYCNIIPPICVVKLKKRRDKNKLSLEYFKIWEYKIINYLKEEISKGHYASGEDINRKFKISHIWQYFKVSELYKKVGLKPYHERASRFKVLVPSNVSHDP